LANQKNKGSINKQWATIDSDSSLSTKDKLNKLIQLNLKKKKTVDTFTNTIVKSKNIDTKKPFVIIESFFSIEDIYGDTKLSEWNNISQKSIQILFPNENIKNINIKDFLYFDTETTGLSGGTGTIPFMLGFGFFKEQVFKTKIFILNDISAEENMLSAVDDFIKSENFSAVVTYNGKSYDYPLMETRYIMCRKKFPLLKIPHLDFLYPSRIIWKNTFESRRLGYLGDVLLGISRDDDIDGSMIPSLYFSYIRTGDFSLIEKVVIHNELDLVGLSALMLKGAKYIENIDSTDDDGEILGVGNLYEKVYNFAEAEQQYKYLIENTVREEIKLKAIKLLSIIKKKSKLYNEAIALWKLLENSDDKDCHRELAIFYEHKELDYIKALNYAEKGLDMDLSECKRKELIKRIERLKAKIKNSP